MEYLISGAFFLILICWIVVFIQSHKMFYLFRKNYPEIAKKEISFAFEPFAHPDKIFFFFKKKNQAIIKNDIELWKLKNKTQIFLNISLISLVIIVTIFLLFGLWYSVKQI